jgi:hypothetical protein
MTRRTNLTVLAAALVAAPSLTGKDEDTVKDILEASLKEKKGVMVYMHGQSVAGVVTKLDGEFVELRSREYSRIALRLNSIDGVAMS